MYVMCAKVIGKMRKKMEIKKKKLGKKLNIHIFVYIKQLQIHICFNILSVREFKKERNNKIKNKTERISIQVANFPGFSLLGDK